MNVSGASGILKPVSKKGPGVVRTNTVVSSDSTDCSLLQDYAVSLKEKSDTDKKSAMNRTQKLIKQMNSKEPETDRDGRKIFSDTSMDKKTGFSDPSSLKNTNKKKTQSSNYRYNYAEVANRIRRAKTSVGAGQAVTAAKRKVLEVRRQICSKKGDACMLQLSLIHARRMEMTAARKKQHLELEELISRTIKSDEIRDKSEEAAENIKNAEINITEEKLLKEEDEIFNDRLDMLDEFISENGKAPDDEAVTYFNQLVSEFGEDELERLEEEISDLEKTEFINPHMDEKKFERLKIKHRNAENKALLMAEMDYLKGVFKHLGSNGSISGFSLQSGSVSSGIDLHISSATAPVVEASSGVNVVV